MTCRADVEAMTAQQEGGRYPIDAVPSGLSTWSARVQALPAIIAAVTAVIVALLTSVLAIKREQRQRTAAEQQERIRLYFSPLRIAVAENLYRLTELHSVAAKNGSVPALCAVAKPSELEQKDLTWFNGTGAYLASSSYYAACVFASINRVRSELPYLRLKQEQDTLLLTQLRKVSLGYLRNLGVFFATQDSIGEMLIHDNKVMSYKNYCELLRPESASSWATRPRR